MKVAELIRKLKKLNPNLRVFVGTGDEYSNELLPDGMHVAKATVDDEDGNHYLSILVIGNGDGSMAIEEIA